MTTIKEGAYEASQKRMSGMTMTIVGDHLVVIEEVIEGEVETVQEMIVGVRRKMTRVLMLVVADGTISTSKATHHRHLEDATQLHEDDRMVAGVEEVVEQFPMGGEDEVAETMMDGEDEEEEVIEVVDNSMIETLSNGSVGTVQENKRKNEQSI